MAVENPTAANVSLWTRFFQDEWGVEATRSRPSDLLSRAAAAAVSSWLTVAMAPRIDRLYRENAPQVSEFGFSASQPQSADEPPVPAELRNAEPEPRREPNPPERRRRYERRSSSSVGTSSAATSKSEMATITH